MKTTFIYTISDEHGEIRYIGKSNNPKNRLYKHLNEKSNIHKYNWLKAIIKRGKFPIVEILDEVPIETWNIYEIYWISQFKAWGFNLLNISSGGFGREGGYKHSIESKRKMSILKLNGKLSKSHIKNISIKVKEKFQSNPNYNKCQDKEHIINKDELYQRYITEGLSLNECAKIFNTSKHTIYRNIKEHNFKKSKSDWSHKLSTQPKLNINQYDLDGNFIKRWIGACTIQNELGFDSSTIINCCKGRSNKSHGFVWRFDGDIIIRDIKLNKKPLSIVQLKDNVLVCRFKSIAEASRITNIQRSSIGYCCKGKLKTAGGYNWKYENYI